MHHFLGSSLFLYTVKGKAELDSQTLRDVAWKAPFSMLMIRQRDSQSLNYRCLSEDDECN